MSVLIHSVMLVRKKKRKKGKWSKSPRNFKPQAWCIGLPTLVGPRILKEETSGRDSLVSWKKTIALKKNE